MSERIVPDLKTHTFGECSFENCDIGPDDIDWCTGFWNEMAGEITPRCAFEKTVLHKSPFFILTILSFDPF